jgi:phosphoribosylamine-glycine ligase
MKKILLIGKSGRNDCIADAIAQSQHPKQLFIFSDVVNHGLRSKALEVRKGRSESGDEVASYAAEVKPDFAIIGPEEPLATGVVDRLAEMGIPCVGPTQALAQLESSKSFTRRLISKYRIPGNPEHRIFRSIDGMESYLRRQTSFVIKPDGLTSGKGVQVFGEHLKTIDQAFAYSRELFAAGQSAVIVEEKLDGEEFSFQSFCDGYHGACQEFCV